MIRRITFFTTAMLTAVLLGTSAVGDVDLAIENFANEDSAVRLNAINAAAEAGTQATRKLLDALENGDVRVKLSALQALSHIADYQAQEELSAVLQDDPDSFVRAAAARAVAAYADQQALESLRIAASEDDDEYVRASAAIAIGTVRSKPAVDLLVWLLKSNDERVQSHAASSLKDITMRNFGTDFDEWREWWIDNREDFVITMATPPFLPLEEEDDEQ